MNSFFRKEDDIVSLCLKMYNCHRFIDFPSIHLQRRVKEIIASPGILKFSLKKRKENTKLTI